MKKLDIDFCGIELKLTKNSGNILSTYLKEKASYDSQEYEP